MKTVNDDYDNDLDKKYHNLDKLCISLNKIKGVSKVRYWGANHNHAYLNIAFNIIDIKYLMIIARALDNRYGGPPRYDVKNQWFIAVECTDSLPGYTFNLKSFNMDEHAYQWAEKISENIEETLTSDNVLKYYGLSRE
jgi:hypothetical protein